mmetsp:Transcript_36422/g.64799  ORF Transcript_36422/g.64799 Transcript_36422/m.64799 type:complete len:476 (-) Transcript_36422:247-1674(-)
MAEEGGTGPAPEEEAGAKEDDEGEEVGEDEAEENGENKEGEENAGALEPYSGSPTATLPPPNVQSWLKREDWDALTKAWEEAEAKAIAWAEGADIEDEYWEESPVQSPPAHSVSSLPPLSSKRRRPKWNQDFHLMGQDHRRPQPLRRYFDKLPAENSLPKALRGEDRYPKFDYEQRNSPLKHHKTPNRKPQYSTLSSTSMQTRRPWAPSHHLSISVDNDQLHPHLRHYFDRRGLEAGYRNRPAVAVVTQTLRPRTPQRPSTREKILKFRSESMPAMMPGAERHTGSMHWGTRCLMYGPDYKAKPKPSPKKSASQSLTRGNVERIPWVSDHHVSVAEDNSILNPMLRHYFDADGLESSFRNRGIHYGRKARSVWGHLPVPSKPPGATDSRRASSAVSSVGSSMFDGSISSSLLDELDFWVQESEYAQSGTGSQLNSQPGSEFGSRAGDLQPIDPALAAIEPAAAPMEPSALPALEG